MGIILTRKKFITHDTKPCDILTGSDHLNKVGIIQVRTDFNKLVLDQSDKTFICCGNVLPNEIFSDFTDLTVLFSFSGQLNFKSL